MGQFHLAELADADRAKQFFPGPADLIVAGLAGFGRRLDRRLAQGRSLRESAPAAEALEERQQGDEGVLVQLVFEERLDRGTNSFSDSLTWPRPSKSQAS